MLQDNTFLRLLLLTEDVRNDPFWKDNLVYCDECGGNPKFRCHRPGSSRCPKLHTGLDDEPYRDNIKGD